jgi:hypothetical protein
MKRVVLVLLLFFPAFLNAQFWEVGAFAGASNYNGDLSEGIKFKETHFAYGSIIRYNINRHLSVKGNIIKGMISGTDANAKKYYHRQWSRNLSFRSTVLDIGIQPEFNILGYRTNHFTYKSSPYIFAGVSLLRFNPQALYNEKWTNLQPLGTEGQYLNVPEYEDRKYTLTQIVIPFGIGWKYSIGKNINLGFELSARKTFTDYLDDVSTNYVDDRDLLYRNGQIAVNLANRTGEVNDEKIPKTEDDPRGSPDAKDWYYFTGFTLSYSLLPQGCLGY